MSILTYTNTLVDPLMNLHEEEKHTSFIYLVTNNNRRFIIKTMFGVNITLLKTMDTAI